MMPTILASYSLRILESHFRTLFPSSAPGRLIQLPNLEVRHLPLPARLAVAVWVEVWVVWVEVWVEVCVVVVGGDAASGAVDDASGGGDDASGGGDNN